MKAKLVDNKLVKTNNKLVNAVVYVLFAGMLVAGATACDTGYDELEDRVGTEQFAD